MKRRALLIGTFDTKGAEYALVRSLILGRGHDVLTMDIGILGDAPPPFAVDISADEVARAGGGMLADLRARGDRGSAVDVMQRGAQTMAAQLFAANRFDGVLGLGGGGGTTMITGAMRELPVGVPKVMVSTMASGNTAPYVDVKDITMMYSVVDIAGINPISRRILTNAAGAICGMLEAMSKDIALQDRPIIASTMFGVTTPCVTAARQRLEAAGFDVVVFHATGTGGRAMEGLIDDGFFRAVLDVTTTEWADEVVGGVLTAGPDRLAAAGRQGIPQVVSVGALDMVNFGAADTMPARFASRNLYKHNATVTLMRTTPDECREIGSRIIGQLNQATGPVTLVLPLRGVSMLDAPGKPFHDPDADQALFESLRGGAGSHVNVREIDAHINDPVFADALAEELLALMPSGVGA
ncbi:MAG: Tm-1-like ATP-binding domain-containing protein [Gemmatimonadaceae bacterium]